MRGNFTFRNKEDAENLVEGYGGQIHDNTHNVPEWRDNQYTVHIDNDNAVDQYKQFLTEDDDD